MRNCSICNSVFPNFLPMPEQYVRQINAFNVGYSLCEFETLNLAEYLCPVCGATDRDRLYALYFSTLYKIVSGERFRVLDIAPSKPLSWFLRNQPGVQYRSGDLYSDLADERVDICHMPHFADASFDLIVCSHVLEHVKDDRMAMRELYRVLSPEGRAILMVPILTTASDIDEEVSELSVEDRWRRFGQDDHVRMYNRIGWLSRLYETGWFINKLEMDDFGAQNFTIHGISKTSVLYIGSHLNT